MSKFEPQVGEDFPLQDGEGRPHGRHHHWHNHWHRRPHQHRLHRGFGGHHHRHHGLGRIAILLVAAGLVSLVVNHQLTAAMSFGLIGAGAGLLVLGILARAVFHTVWRRRLRRAEAA